MRNAVLFSVFLQSPRDIRILFDDSLHFLHQSLGWFSRSVAGQQIPADSPRELCARGEFGVGTLAL